MRKKNEEMEEMKRKAEEEARIQEKRSQELKE